MVRNQIHPASKGDINFDLFEDWNIIIGGIYQTFGMVDLKNIRAYEFLNMLIPNISKDTLFMNVIRLRSTPNNKLSKEERELKRKYRLTTKTEQSEQGFINILQSLAR